MNKEGIKVSARAILVLSCFKIILNISNLLFCERLNLHISKKGKYTFLALKVCIEVFNTILEIMSYTAFALVKRICYENDTTRQSRL